MNDMDNNDLISFKEFFNSAKGMSVTDILMDIFMAGLLILLIIAGTIGYNKYGDEHEIVIKKIEKSI